MIFNIVFFGILSLVGSGGLLISPVECQATATASIKDTIEYLEQVNCVRNCIWDNEASYDVRNFIGCGSPWLNGCICNPHSSSSISLFLTTCVMAACSSATASVSSAVLVYSEYCIGDVTLATFTTDSIAPYPISTFGMVNTQIEMIKSDVL